MSKRDVVNGTNKTVQRQNPPADPALLGAERPKGTNVLQLGFDSSVAVLAADAHRKYNQIAALDNELDRIKQELDSYARNKINAWNKTFQDTVKSVVIKFAQPGDAEGNVTGHLRVTIPDRWSIRQELVGPLQDRLGKRFAKFFSTRQVYKAKPNAYEELVRDIVALGHTRHRAIELVSKHFDSSIVYEPTAEFVQEREQISDPETLRALDLAATPVSASVVFAK